MRFLLDTDVLSEPLRPEPNAGVLAGLERHGAQVATSALNLHDKEDVGVLGIRRAGGALRGEWITAVGGGRWSPTRAA